jgi:hypothetical protein
MEVMNQLSLPDCLAQNIEPGARKVLGQYFVGYQRELLARHLPRVAVSTVADDKFLFGYLSALGDLITALQAEPAGDEPAQDSNNGMLL